MEQLLKTYKGERLKSKGFKDLALTHKKKKKPFGSRRGLPFKEFLFNNFGYYNLDMNSRL